MPQQQLTISLLLKTKLLKVIRSMINHQQRIIQRIRTLQETMLHLIKILSNQPILNLKCQKKAETHKRAQLLFQTKNQKLKSILMLQQEQLLRSRTRIINKQSLLQKINQKLILNNLLSPVTTNL